MTARRRGGFKKIKFQAHTIRTPNTLRIQVVLMLRLGALLIQTIQTQNASCCLSQRLRMARLYKRKNHHVASQITHSQLKPANNASIVRIVQPLTLHSGIYLAMLTFFQGWSRKMCQWRFWRVARCVDCARIVVPFDLLCHPK